PISFGKGNSRPVFAQKNIRPVGCRILGKNRSVVKMNLMDEWGGIIDGVYFGDGDGFVSQIREKGAVDVVYYATIDRWQGRQGLQALASHFQSSELRKELKNDILDSIDVEIDQMEEEL